MSNDVIKNPARGAPRHPRKYEPEYKRLGLHPQVMGDDGQATPIPDYDEFDREPSSDPNGHMIDNNDYVDLGPYSPIMSKPHKQQFAVVAADGMLADAPSPPSVDVVEIPSPSPKVGDFILMVSGKLIVSGSMSDVQSRVKSILYREDSEYADIELTMDDIVVLKRVDIKVGVFIEE
jgi:hypothetical protein